MDLHTILLQIMPSKEIRARLSNRQIKVNNEVVVTSKIEVEASGPFVSLGDFVYRHILKLPNCFNYIDIKDFFGEGETNVEGAEFLSDFTLVSVSKREHIVFRRKKKPLENKRPSDNN